MRLNKILAIAALGTLAVSVVAAQTVVRISAYVSPGVVAHELLGPRDTAGAGIFPPLTQGTLPPTGQGIYNLFLSVHPDPTWLTGGPNTSTRWATLSFSISYNSNVIDFIVLDPNNGNPLRLSQINPDQTIDLSPYIEANPPAAGIAAGQRLPVTDPSNVVVTFALANTSNTNGLAAHGAYLRDWFKNEYDDSPLQVWVNSDAIQGIYNTGVGVPEGNIIIQVNPSDSSRDVQVFGSFIVPEPASMIALGSGLVGLLALRRRKK